MTKPAHLRQRFLVLHNSAAGRNNIGQARAVVDELQKRNAEVAFVELGVASEPDLTQVETYDAVVVSGGDGTVRAIAEKLRPLQIPLGVIPNGTGNVLAGELALPTRAPEIAELLIHGPVQPVKGAVVNGMLFLAMFGAGFDGDVINDLSRGAIQTVGKLAFAGPIMRALIRKPRLFDVTVDGSASRASWILISNASRYGGRFRLTDRTSMKNNELVALISRATTRRQRVAELLRLIAGRFANAPTIEVRSVAVAEIAGAMTAAQCDGEPLRAARYLIGRPDHETLVIAPGAAHSV